MTPAELHADAIVWDNHGCLPLEADDRFLPQLERYRNAGVSFVSLNVGDADVPYDQVMAVLAFFRNWIAARPEDYILVRRADDVLTAKREGKLAIAFDIEGMISVQDDLPRIAGFYDLGVRWMLMAYNKNNKAGGGCQDEDAGLTALGAQICDEMDRVGMVKCLSHTGYRTARDVFERTKLPAIFSHSNARALRDHPRNIPDDLITACAATGGVIGINGIGIFLGDNDNRIETMIRHIDYVAKSHKRGACRHRPRFHVRYGRVRRTDGREGPYVADGIWLQAGYQDRAAGSPAEIDRGNGPPRLFRAGHPWHPRRELLEGRAAGLEIEPPRGPIITFVTGGSKCTMK